MQFVRIAFADRAGEGGRLAELFARQLGVVTAEVSGLSHFGDGVGPRLAGLAHHDGAELVMTGFQRIAHGFEDFGATVAAQRIPGGLRHFSALEGFGDHDRIGVVHLTDNAGDIRRGKNMRGIGRMRLAADQGIGFLRIVVERSHRGCQAFAHGIYADVRTLGVQPVAIHIARQRQFGVAIGMGHDLFDRIGNDIFRIDLFIEQGVDERRIGAIFQQAAHQIGQQVLMSTDRGIGA